MVVLDDVQLLHDQEGLDALAVLVDHLPQGSQLVVISRAAPLLPMARWRVEGRLAELGPGELAMDPAGGRVAACRGQGRAGRWRGGRADPADRGAGRRPCTWPPCRSRPSTGTPPRSSSAGGSGSWSTTCSRRCWPASPRTEVQFLTRTAVLDRLSGPLCDAVLGTTGSAEILEVLERSNLLVVPLDRQRAWYRYHQLFRELLRGELERPSPSWWASSPAGRPNGASSTGCPRPRSATPWMPAMPTWSPGGGAGGHRRLPQRPAGHRPALVRLVRRPRPDPAVSRGGHAGAWVQALGGHAAAAERWAAAAERGSYEGLLPDGSASIEGWRPCCGPSCAATGSPRCGPTPSWP